MRRFINLVNWAPLPVMVGIVVVGLIAPMKLCDGLGFKCSQIAGTARTQAAWDVPPDSDAEMEEHDEPQEKWGDEEGAPPQEKAPQAEMDPNFLFHLPFTAGEEFYFLGFLREPEEVLSI